MANMIVPLTQRWAGPQPTQGYIVKIADAPGRAMNVVYSAGRAISGSFDIVAELNAGAGSKAMTYVNAPNKNPTPTSLSLHVNGDLVVGIKLAKSLGVVFAANPLSGGYACANEDYFSVTRVSDTQAYVIIKGAGFAQGECVKPFNIHLVGIGEFDDNIAYATPIILDPDGRYPDGGLPG